MSVRTVRSKRHSLYNLQHKALALAIVACAGLVSTAQGAYYDLGVAKDFTVLSKAGISSDGTAGTHIVGNIGVSPIAITAITGFGPATLTGSKYGPGSMADQAVLDVGTAYTYLSGLPATTLASGGLGGLNLASGVYKIGGAATLGSALTLDSNNNPDAFFVFQIATTLTTTQNVQINMINGGSADNVYFLLGEAATLAEGTQFTGNIIASSAITLLAGANVEGRLLAGTAVSLIQNVVTMPVAVPEPTSIALLALGSIALLRRRVA